MNLNCLGKLPPFFLLTFSFLLSLAAVPAATAAPPGAATPYMFVGRVMDSAHAGFDTNRVCTLTAISATGEALVQARTFFRENTRNNYALRVPVATAEADGFALKGDPLTITATDDKGKVWEGVIPESFCGGSGGVREVDIVLGEDKDGDGIDDDLLEQLLAQWEAGKYWQAGTDFDPHGDHDGDGVSTLDEALAGTDPFDENSVFAISSFAHSPETGVAVEFPTTAGRSYELQTATDLSAADWTSTVPATTLSTPATARSSKATLYLLPSAASSAVFFRVLSK
ncbi:MAG: hypothetical protein IK066_01480 [Kiritimatiellae bacterium]|nr:hypothetical protein [Kiritimatiellia bacterium]